MTDNKNGISYLNNIIEHEVYPYEIYFVELSDKNFKIKLKAKYLLKFHKNLQERKYIL